MFRYWRSFPLLNDAAGAARVGRGICEEAGGLVTRARFDSPAAPEPLAVRKATLASVLAKASPGLRLNEHFEDDGPGCAAVKREAEEDWAR